MGCGNGNFINYFFSKNINLNITGVDSNEDLLNEIKNLTNYKNLNLIHSDFDEVEIKNQKFDWIFFIYSIYYSQKPIELIYKMHSYLKDNGQLVIIGPGKSNAIELDKLNKKITGLDPKPEYRVRQQELKMSFMIFAQKYLEIRTVN